MTREQKLHWQEDGRRAFDWIASVYAQTRAVWDDAQSTFAEDGWTVQNGSGWGGAAAGILLDQWPFVYLKAFCATPPNVSGNSETGVAAVFGFFFYDGVRQGPQCFGGRVSWSKMDAKLNHWFLYNAMGGPVGRQHQELFEREAGTNSIIRIARPNAKARNSWPGADELRWFEIPLGFLSTAEELRNLVRATQALMLGDEQPAHALMRSLDVTESKP